MLSKPANNSVSSDMARFRALAVFFCMALLCVGVLAIALPFSAHAKAAPLSAQLGSGSPHKQAPQSAPRTDKSAYSDAGRSTKSQPDITGGPDAFGYTFADDRDPGGPVYNYVQGDSRVPDDGWVHLNSENYSALDDGVYTRTLPFSFNFYGVTYNSVHISTNGNIHFGAPNDWYPVASNNACLPSNEAHVPQAMIAPLWFDFTVPAYPTSTDGVYIGTQGSPPNQNFIVEWRNVLSAYDDSVRASFEVVINQNGDITYQYANLPGGGTTGLYGVVGIQNGSGTVGLPYSCYQDTLTNGRAIRYHQLQGAFFLPSSGSQGAAPGAAVTYTTSLYNAAPIDTSYVLTPSGNSWNTTVIPRTTGTIPRNSTVPITITVHIPPTTTIGTRDVATILASSTVTQPTTYTATFVLTTSVTTSGIDFSPANPVKGGDFGAPVVYTMRLYNRTGQTNSIQLSGSPSNWPATFSPSYIASIPNGGYVPVTVTVQVPATATLGMQDTFEISASAQQPSPGAFLGNQLIRTTAGAWHAQADTPQARSRAAAVAYGSGGQVFVLGGESQGGNLEASILDYDSATNHWYSAANLAVPVTNAGAGVIGDTIYVVGGYDGANVQSVLQAYNPLLNSVLVISSDPLPQPRFGAGVAALNNKLYVIGGADNSQAAQNTVYEFDPVRPAGSRWQLKSAMPTARLYLGAAAVDGIIYAVGGVSRVVQPVDLATVEAYDPATDTWSSRASMTTPRGGLALVGVNSNEPGCGAHLYALGGGYNTPLASAEMYDPAGDTWQPISAMQMARRTLAAAYSPVTRSVVAVGGWDEAVQSEVESVACSLGASYCATGFPDVAPYSTFYPYVRCLSCQGILSGYSDGTFGPGNNVTRGQLSKIVSNAAAFNEAHTTQSFEDVPPSGAFYIWVERLSSRGIIGGYACGGAGESCDAQNRPYFRPNAAASRGQITKIVANAAGVNDTVPQDRQTFADVASNSPFWLFVERLYARGVMSGYSCGGAGEPCDPANRPYFRTNAEATRGQIAKIVSNTFFPNCATTQSSKSGK